ncbi:MAG TPA: hypothetical protein DEP23_02080 [Ruminococcaceae bacterium]|nr:hypothetical protein [Oscillospiraceae bacterium]
MNNQPSVLVDPQRVKQAIDSARSYAEDRGVSMTVERLAVCLGMPSRKILEFALCEEEPNHDFKESFLLLKMACEEIAASHIEHGMTKGNNPSMDILMLKSNLNYRDKAEQTVQNTAVVFIGEDAIKD